MKVSDLTFPQELGFERTITLVLTAPPYILAAIVGLVLAWSSGRMNERTWHITICKGIAIVGFIISVSTLNVGARYFSIYLFVAFSFGVNNIMLGCKFSCCTPLSKWGWFGCGVVGRVAGCGRDMSPPEPPPLLQHRKTSRLTHRFPQGFLQLAHRQTKRRRLPLLLVSIFLSLDVRIERLLTSSCSQRARKLRLHLHALPLACHRRAPLPSRLDRGSLLLRWCRCHHMVPADYAEEEQREEEGGEPWRDQLLRVLDA